MPLRIEDYALIGDCETAALVGRDGSIDWLCWPRFDSDACFAALLGTPDHGRWLIGPVDSDVRTGRRYRDGTLILETTFETGDGAATLIDFMPLRSSTSSDIVRILVGLRGKLAFRTELVVRFGYGATVPWASRTEGVLRIVAGPDMVVMRTPAPLRGENLKTVGEFTVSAGQTIPFALSYVQSHLDAPDGFDATAILAETEAAWRSWSSRCHGAGDWSEAVVRSLITLKALTYRPTGGIVAAPTTSLPEQPGGSRNWDYRYCWLRDATLSLLALMGAGYYEEAEAWRDWLLRAVAGSPAQMQIMYGLAGERRLTEWEVPWLPGYEDARPVRIGNAAQEQRQLDVFGEVMDALHQARLGKIAESSPGWSVQRVLLEHLSNVWDQPDEGIWEVRGGPQQFTYSKVMCWVALDRAVKQAERYGLEGPIEQWRALRDRVHDDVCRNGYDPSLGSFVQAYGTRQLDASLLLIPTVGFLPPSDPRVQGTVVAIERELLEDGLVMRYKTERVADGLPPGEGAFLACSFWLADAYILLGRHDDARRLFERLLGLRNDVGLLAEEYDMATKRQLGNFPQAFSHVALVNTAYNLTKAKKPARQRAGHEESD
jgi:GH15 family glucan-1,4-alpha-glucosidase